LECELLLGSLTDIIESEGGVLSLDFEVMTLSKENHRNKRAWDSAVFVGSWLE
jgi:hypothetical protein